MLGHHAPMAMPSINQASNCLVTDLYKNICVFFVAASIYVFFVVAIYSMYLFFCFSLSCETKTFFTQRMVEWWVGSLGNSILLFPGTSYVQRSKTMLSLTFCRECTVQSLLVFLTQQITTSLPALRQVIFGDNPSGRSFLGKINPCH